MKNLSSLYILIVAASGVAVEPLAQAQFPIAASSGTVVASGLNGPRGLTFGPDGTLYIAEAGTGGTTSTVGNCAQTPAPIGPYKGGTNAAIAELSSDGTLKTLASGLASSVAATGDLQGVADVAFLDGKLYGLVAGGGCSHGNPSLPNGIVKVNLTNGKWSYITDLSVFYLEHPVAFPDAADYEPDGVPYSFVPHNGRLFTLEPNHGLLTATGPGGATTQVIDFTYDFGHIVPTSIATDNENLYVGNLGLFPISSNNERITTLSKDLGFIDTTPGFQTKPAELNKFRVAASRAGFTAVVSVKVGPDGLLYVLELSDTPGGYPNPGDGKVLRVNANGSIQPVISGLAVPTGMTFGPDRALYISNFGAAPAGAGQILRIAIPM